MITMQLTTKELCEFFDGILSARSDYLKLMFNLDKENYSHYNDIYDILRRYSDMIENMCSAQGINIYKLMGVYYGREEEKGEET